MGTDEQEAKENGGVNWGDVNANNMEAKLGVSEKGLEM